MLPEPVVAVVLELPVPLVPVVLCVLDEVPEPVVPVELVDWAFALNEATVKNNAPTIITFFMSLIDLLVEH